LQCVKRVSGGDWVANEGATSVDLQRLEKAADTQIPDTLLAMLTEINGGLWFDDKPSYTTGMCVLCVLCVLCVMYLMSCMSCMSCILTPPPCPRRANPVLLRRRRTRQVQTRLEGIVCAVRRRRI